MDKNCARITTFRVEQRSVFIINPPGNRQFIITVTFGRREACGFQINHREGPVVASTSSRGEPSIAEKFTNTPGLSKTHRLTLGTSWPFNARSL